MDSQAFLTFYQAVQKATLPAIWSRGVSLARENAILPEHQKTAPGAKTSEINFKIRVQNRPVSPRVTLWIEDEDWYCDCGDRNDPCVHVAAVVVWLKTAPEAQISAPSPSHKGLGTLSYRFKTQGQALTFARFVVWGETEILLTPDQSLVSLIGGITSGRIPKPPIAATSVDLAIDSSPKSGPTLLASLEDCPDITLDGERISVAATPVSPVIELTDQASGFRLCLRYPEGVRFSNEMILNAGVLRALNEPKLEPAQKQRLLSPGLFFSGDQALELLTQILPELHTRARVDIKSTRLPVLEDIFPRIEIEMQKDSQGNLEVFPHLYYGAPPLAEIRGGRLVVLPLGRTTNRLPKRDLVKERELLQDLRHELFLTLDQRTTYQGIEAVRMASTLAAYNADHRTTSGESQAFIPQGVLRPSLSFENNHLDLRFGLPTVAAAVADAKHVFEAWKQGENVVPLLGGGWATLPRDWLERYAKRALHLLAKQAESSGSLAPHFMPELGRLFEDCGQTAGAEFPASLARLRALWQDLGQLPETALPADLTAAVDMRSYQREGFRWLSFLKQCGMGALLADDMGLGKTLQVMATFSQAATSCSVSRSARTLVVCPTSVLKSWMDQLTAFRPGLRVSIYHGSKRDVSAFQSSDVVLTTYGVLRLDLAALTSHTWDTVVLDEAQMIRNADSQMAQAAFQLKAGFRVALSGTPIENRVQDLWSIFNFTHPGLLGEKSEFPNSELVRRKIRPFILRRLKQDVAAELPPRTEATLVCELSESERESYNSILAATRKEILDKLTEDGGDSDSQISVMNLLTALLRLRQACCHSSLVTGETEHPAAPSSKIELLLEQLSEVTSMGHRCLVFSQWTSFLDLVEPHLRQAGLGFVRLDGTTSNRSEVISQFQDPQGPPVFLLSLKAGGVGLNLTAADYVFLLDPWWNPATEAQAADRAHRIGQTKPVMIYRLIAANTIEERVLVLQSEKRQLAQNLLEETGDALKREDLLALLA
ncbi:DEAD/DEAH box helicase [Bdellovibrionota bacterium FG-2]